MNVNGDAAGALWILIANSSGFLLLGLFAAGLVHALAHKFEAFQRSIPRGIKAIGLGIVAGLPLPVCSCGIVPVAVALKRRNAHPETVASFVVSTPETSLDAVGLTAALLGLPFALLRILAGVTAAFLGGIFVIAMESWPQRERVSVTDAHHDHDHSADGHAPAEWWNRFAAAATDAVREFLSAPKSPAAPALEVEKKPSNRTRVRRTIAEAVRFGFVETLDEIAWMLLTGFILSAILVAFLPNDFATRIPGGLVGQTLFGLAISLPLYVCASGSIPLAAALMMKGLSPIAVMTIFLVGPLTNPAMLLLLTRSFGRRFVVALVVAGLLAAIAFGGIAATFARLPLVSETSAQPAASVGGWDIFFAAIFIPILALSLARAGVRRGLRDIRAAFASVLPYELRAKIRDVINSVTPRRRAAAWSVLGALAIAWILSGCAVIQEGTVGFAELFGKAERHALAPGLHWNVPPPFGRVRVVDSGAVIDVSVGFRPEQSAPNEITPFTAFSDSGWHSVYTSSGSRPEESAYVTGDLNLVESKAGIHLLVSDARAFAYQGGDPIATVRSMYQASLRELLASRSIDDTLTTARASIEQAALRDLQRRLVAANVPLHPVSVNLLDLHPPDAAVRAFRDISSALEDRETRIHQARGKADAALPFARGAAVVMLASAESDRRENVARAAGVSTAFAVQADVARRNGAAVRSMLRWNALDRLFLGKRLVLMPHATTRELVEMPQGGSY